MTNTIEKTVEIAASPERVWRALTDHEEFGAWFRVQLEGPFVVGEVSTGRITYPGYEHLPWEATVHELEPERRFVYTWGHVDDSGNAIPGAETTVTFIVDTTADGTRVTVIEAGFDGLPPEIRGEVLRQNEAGWAEQMRNIAAYVARHP